MWVRDSLGKEGEKDFLFANPPLIPPFIKGD